MGQLGEAVASEHLARVPQEYRQEVVLHRGERDVRAAWSDKATLGFEEPRSPQGSSGLLGSRGYDPAQAASRTRKKLARLEWFDM